jgi:hypothetical protein
VEPLPAGSINGSLQEKNITDFNAVRDITKDAIRRAGHALK